MDHLIAEIRRRRPALADLEAKGTIRIAGAMYDLATGVATFFALVDRPSVSRSGTNAAGDSIETNGALAALVLR